MKKITALLSAAAIAAVSLATTVSQAATFQFYILNMSNPFYFELINIDSASVNYSGVGQGCSGSVALSDVVNSTAILSASQLLASFVPSVAEACYSGGLSVDLVINTVDGKAISQTCSAHQSSSDSNSGTIVSGATIGIVENLDKFSCFYGVGAA